MDVDVGVLSLVQLPIILYTPDTAYSFVQHFSGEMMGWIFERMYICCKTYLLGQIVEIELPKEKGFFHPLWEKCLGFSVTKWPYVFSVSWQILWTEILLFDFNEMKPCILLCCTLYYSLHTVDHRHDILRVHIESLSVVEEGMTRTRTGPSSSKGLLRICSWSFIVLLQ